MPKLPRKPEIELCGVTYLTVKKGKVLTGNFPVFPKVSSIFKCYVEILLRYQSTRFFLR